MWFDRRDRLGPDHYALTRPYLRFDDGLWREIAGKMAAAGMNMVVLDLGDGVRYASHPEIAVKGAWTAARLRRELARLRALGLEPIPKLNFSAGHDNWLGPYARCLSTPEYYRVCADLIAEVCELFDRPRFFHIGMDEETAVNQVHNQYIVIRAGDLWWHDLKYLCNQVARHGARPWMWADAHWFHGDAYPRNVSRHVIQGNWWYGPVRMARKMIRSMPELGPRPVTAWPVRTYRDLDRAGYDQILTASNWSDPDNLRATAAFARRHLSRRHVLGFLQTTWKPMLPEFRQLHLEAIDQAAVEIARWHGRPARVPAENPDAPLAIPPKAGLRVGIYYANPDADGLRQYLNARPGRWNAFILPRLERADWRQCEIVVISRAGSAWRFNLAAGRLRKWAESGGRLMLVYDAAGWGRYRALFPELARAIGKSRQPVIAAGSLDGRLDRAAGRRFRHAFADHLQFRPGRAGRTAARDADGRAAVVAGRIGAGRVVLYGLFADGCPCHGGRRAAELRHFEECLQWLGADGENLKP